MNYSTQAFFAGQHEGILMVLQALHDSESEKEMDKQWVVDKLRQLGLDEFTNGILNNYFLDKEESK